MVLLEGRELLELLSEQVNTELHGCVFVKVVEVLHVLCVDSSRASAIVIVQILDLFGHHATQGGGVLSRLDIPITVESLVIGFRAPQLVCVTDDHVLLSLIRGLHELIDGGFIEYAAAGTEKDGADQPAHPTEHVDVAGSSRIVEAHPVQPAFAKDPGRADGVD